MDALKGVMFTVGCALIGIALAPPVIWTAKWWFGVWGL